MKTFWGWRDEQLPDGTVIRLGDTPNGGLSCDLVGGFLTEQGYHPAALGWLIDALAFTTHDHAEHRDLF